MNKYSKQISYKRNKSAPKQTNRISATFDIDNFGIASVCPITQLPRL